MIYENTQNYTIEKGCPWYEMQQTFGPPNVNWCEPTYCQLVNEPATAWSNFAIIIPGLIIQFLSKGLKHPIIKNFGYFIMAMGLFSFIYHSTNNYLTQFFDFVGMYLYTGALITINVLRMNKLFIGKEWRLYWTVFLINIIIFWIFHFLDLPIQFCIVLNIGALIVMEWISRSETVAYKYFWLNLFFIALAQTFSLLDHTRVWCNPANVVLHGHALWHVFAGVSSVFAYLYYKQFNLELKLSISE